MTHHSFKSQDLLLSRRGFLIGCSLAASPLLTPVTFAATEGENRLVVIVLRGAMDGLDVVRPLGDRAYLPLRPDLAADAAASHDLDGFFALHPAAAPLMPLWSAGELAFAHAVATPYRQGRSHFIGQDALENGTGLVGRQADRLARRLVEPRAGRDPRCRRADRRVGGPAAPADPGRRP